MTSGWSRVGWSVPTVHRTARVRARRRAAATGLAVLCLTAVPLVRGVGATAGDERTPPTAQTPGTEPVGTAPTGVGDVDGLGPSVARSVRLAIQAAAADGVALNVTSGWRSAERQQVLFDEAVATYGSAEQARRWVLPPQESEHVRGGAVDVGPASGAAWLHLHGVRFGLCQRYANEPWHFERLAGAKGSSCPAMEAYP